MAKAVKPSVKKAVAKKTVSKTTVVKRALPVTKLLKKTETGIKYSDKSEGQPALLPIFNAVKKLLLPYGKGNIKIRGGPGGQIILVSDKPVEIGGKMRDEYWFAAALVQKGYVGFYFMPAKTPAEKKEVFKPELLKCLKGKSCFHIKKYDIEIIKEIAASLAKGYRLQKEKGWL